MEHEIERLQRAKMFMDYLANGVDPVSNMDADANTLHNEQVIACFQFVSDVLSEAYTRLKIVQNAATQTSLSPRNNVRS